MQTIKDRKEFLNLYEIYFREKTNISEKNYTEFNIKLTEAISQRYKTLKEKYTKQGDDKYFAKEKISLTSMIDNLKSSKSDWKYITLSITTVASIVSVGLNLVILTSNNYIMKMFDKISLNPDNKNIKYFNDNIIKTSLENTKMILVLLSCVIFGVITLFFICELAEKSIKKSENRKVVFYTWCYNVICDIENGRL
jgi:hypothetical protein